MADAASWQDAILFHAIKLLTLAKKGEQFDVLKEVKLYEQYILKGVYPSGVIGKSRVVVDELMGRSGSHVTASVRCMGDTMRSLCEKYVLPVLTPA